MKNLKTFEQFGAGAIKESIVSDAIRGLVGRVARPMLDKIQEGMKMAQDMVDGDPAVKEGIEEGAARLTEEQRMALSSPGLIQKIVEFFAGRSERSFESEEEGGFMGVLAKVGKFLSKWGVDISLLTTLLGSVASIAASVCAGLPWLAILGVVLGLIAFAINSSTAKDDWDPIDDL
jgi:hypothetical protein